jgi:peptidoglycan/xylan/chitin deacetylase (PgdA/CDA1 family)
VVHRGGVILPENYGFGAMSVPPRFSPFVKFSMGLHAAAAGLALAAPGFWPAALGGVVVNQIALTAAGLLPRATWLGPNLRRLPPTGRPEVALSFDDGPDPAVTPRVLHLLAQADAKATFFCIGTAAAAHPDLVRAIVQAGHQVENHTETHPYHFATLGPASLRCEILAAQIRLTAMTGRAPRWLRAPAGLRNPLLQPVLALTGLGLASWTRRALDGVWGNPQRARDRLLRGLAAGDILLMHDGRAARTPSGEPVVLAILPDVLAGLAARGLNSVTLDQGCAQTPADEV